MGWLVIYLQQRAANRARLPVSWGVMLKPKQLISRVNQRSINSIAGATVSAAPDEQISTSFMPGQNSRDLSFPLSL